MKKNLVTKLLTIALMSFSVSASIAGEFVGDRTAKIVGKALIKELQKGGYVIYFRHGLTGKHVEKNISLDRIADCSVQRNLLDAGIRQTKAIGKAFRTLAIPVNKVYSSPYCRCLDTAMNIFGKAVKSDYLYYATNVKKVIRAVNTAALLNMLATPPSSGSNTAIVSHTANLREAVNIWPKPQGVAHIFKPEGNNKFSYVGIVVPDEWRSLAN